MHFSLNSQHKMRVIGHLNSTIDYTAHKNSVHKQYDIKTSSAAFRQATPLLVGEKHSSLLEKRIYDD